MPQTQIKSLAGNIVDTLDLSERVFAAKVNIPLVHQAVVRHLANQRQGTSSTKTRGQVSGTTKKWFRQKGTGRARHGDRRPSVFVGGGVAHGPHPRDYRLDMPRKMRRQALRVALSAKLADGKLTIVDNFSFEAPRTRQMVQALQTVVPGHRRLLVVFGEANRIAMLSARNIPGVYTTTADSVNTYEVVAAEHVVMTRTAITHIEGVLNNGTV